MNEMDDMIASLGRLARAPREAAKLAAETIESELRESAGAGVSPQGQKWKHTREGKRPMVNAASHIKVEASGTLVRATLSGPDVFHHFGARGEPKRQILPASGVIPQRIRQALDRVGSEAFERATR